MIRYVTCYFWYTACCAGDREQKGPRVTSKTYRTTETVSLFMSPSFSLCLSPRNVRLLQLLHGRMPCHELNDKVARRDGFLRGPRFRNADESSGARPEKRFAVVGSWLLHYMCLIQDAIWILSNEKRALLRETSSVDRGRFIAFVLLYIHLLLILR